MLEVLLGIHELGCDFLVAGRKVEGTFKVNILTYLLTFIIPYHIIRTISGKGTCFGSRFAGYIRNRNLRNNIFTLVCAIRLLLRVVCLFAYVNYLGSKPSTKTHNFVDSFI